ncbi:phosphoenolpyruvate carboxykinase [Candidatus Bathyarchaeota archaeon]|nr:phosphoenolpyruvate carboxykinase [Candidatus Bathyarchaeota archaeon]
MKYINSKLVGRKIIIHTKHALCAGAGELVESNAFKMVVAKSIEALVERNSILLELFDHHEIDGTQVDILVDVLRYLTILPKDDIPKIVEGSSHIIEREDMLFNYVEYLYNFWRSYDRFIICDSKGDELDLHPYRTFNNTIEYLTHLVRKVYRDIQENITGEHPNIYRQVRAGANFGTIALSKAIPMPREYSDKLQEVLVIRQVLLNPPLVLNPPMNKRTGRFVLVDTNPLKRVTLDKGEFVCYPAKVGSLVILVYIHQRFYELGLSLVNLFEIATDEELLKKPDGIYIYGAPPGTIEDIGEYPTIYYEDKENDMIIAAVPSKDEFGYFGYLKKMILTLHNVKMIRSGHLPFHGSMTRIVLQEGGDFVVLLIGDTGAGKSETLEAFREIGEELISDIIVVADDMGSLTYDKEGNVIGHGTEVGAFLRLDDLSPSVAFGQIDRAIFMSPGRTNTRIVIPITSLHHVLEGYKVDIVLYANNYQQVDEDHPIIDRFESVDEALAVFKEGKVMSKGTTTSTGIVQSYFANIFGPPDYKEHHDMLAREFFTKLIENGIFIGQLRTRLGMKGYEQAGPMAAAEALIELFGDKKGKRDS